MSEPLTHNFTINYPCISIPFKVGYQELIDFYTNLEPQTKQYYCDTIQKDWNVVDVGANIGMFALLFGKLTTGKVWAIEASEPNFDMLQQNIEHAGPFVGDVTPLRRYISNKTSKDAGEIHYFWTGRGSVCREAGEFDFVTLDDLFEDQDRIDLIKIDIDGYDFEAVQGAVKIMERIKPIMVIELVDEALRMHGFNKQNVIDFMTENKYTNTKVLDNCNYVFERKE